MTHAFSLTSTQLQDPFSGYSGTNPAGSVPPPDFNPLTRKLFQEAKTFEGLLIDNLWSEMEDGLGLSDSSSDPGAGTMQGFGIQAAAMGIANAGGLGIARMLYRELAPGLVHAQDPAQNSPGGRDRAVSDAPAQ